MELVGPFQSFFSGISSGLTRIKEDYLARVDLHQENKELKSEIAQKNEAIIKLREGYILHTQFEKKLNFKKTLESEYSVSAKIVGRGQSFWLQTVIVDRGENDGVTEGMVAISESGVVGQIIQTSPNYAKVLLANAPSSAIDCIVQKNRTRGILKGRGKNGYVLQYVLKNDDVQVGDDIVTAGISGIFKTGFPIGKVSAVRRKRRGMFLEIEVKPAVDFQRIETLFIVGTERQLIEREMGRDLN